MRVEEMPQIAELYGNAIYGFCRRLVGSKSEADDLYQQTFLSAMELCEKINTQGNPKCFLMGIAVRIWHNDCKKATRRALLAPEQCYSEMTDVPSPYTVEEEAQRRILSMHVAEIAGQLPEKLRVVLIMYYGAQLSLSDIATALKLPQGTVKSRLHKARQILKNQLEAEGYGTSE